MICRIKLARGAIVELDVDAPSKSDALRTVMQLAQGYDAQDGKQTKILSIHEQQDDVCDLPDSRG